MSLTSDIATLVGRADALINIFDAKKAAIDAAVAAAIATLPEMSRTYYVDQVAGNNANSGLVPEQPFQTIDRALSLAGAGRYVDIRLMANYTFTSPRIGLRAGQHLKLGSHLSVSGSIRYKVFLGVHARPEPEVVGDWEVGGFYCPSFGSNSINASSIEIVFPAAPGAGVMVNDSYNGFLAGNVTDGPPVIGLELNGCTVTRPAGSVGVIFGARTHFAALMVKNTTFVTPDMAGKWVAGVAGGSTPASVGWVASNLATL
ncbi:hypothetical protein [Rhizobium herbae]|uniref:Uncharacterized protein n=1 Tax=Rhizobium herbae TaxID=508661 RepID=A0ABS4EVY4_9HYPH|nr:hypothetical protein [Rhizobium herbae]MBP1862129.1 hypothetical protein [Rhizobium herbae]